MLVINAELTAPPSEVTLFRDITLYANTFLDQEIVIECPREERDFYYKWLKQKCALDFIEDFVKNNTVEGITIRREKATIKVERINYSNFQNIIRRIEYLLL